MRNGEATRNKLHTTSLKLFVEKGVTETTVRDIALGAGVAEGTLYRHYASKDALVEDLFQRNYAAFGRTLAELARRHEGHRQKLEAMIGGFCRLFDENPHLFRFLLLAQHQTLPKLRNGFENPVQVVRDVIAAAMRAGAIRARDANLAAGMVIGLVLQPAVFVVYGRLSPPFSRYVGDIAAACWQAIGGR
ncbi:MAG TPA: TetR/AcrR family transcriptional regulator [Alphaproteobacteria bacterium]|nr:TetR/AcrR family transcriptional regulator [Alphaproteobacteria bacterium]